MALRFAVSPLWETVAGLRVLVAPGYSAVHQRWVTWAEERLAGLRGDPWFDLLVRLVTSEPVIPEFLIPTPGLRFVGIDAEVDAVLRATPERVTAALGDSTVLDDEGLVAMRDRLHAAHEAVIAPIWPRLEGVLQGDVERRVRLLVERGAPTVVHALHDAVGMRENTLVVNGVPTRAGERDLVLVPSAFIWPHVYLRDSPVRLALCYPASGFGSLWERSDAPAQPALGRLIGQTRARLLRELDRPSTVLELAGRLGVTVGAVSQHLTVLRAAGLAVSRREGREVVSLRTALGLALAEGETRA